MINRHSNLFLILLIIGLLVAINQIAFSQSEDSYEQIKKNLITNLEEYRGNLLLQNDPSIDSLINMIEEWQRIESNKSKLSSIIGGIFYMPDGKSINALKAYLKKRVGLSTIVERLTEEQVKLVARHYELSNLFVQKILSTRFPYNINVGSMAAEINYFGLEDNQVIGEVGAGNGTYGLLVRMALSPQHLYLNEIDSTAMKHTDRLMSSENLPKLDSPYTIIDGSETSTEFPVKMDRIIMRKALHHFKYMESMLDDIKSQLKPGGMICIKELVPDKDNGCSKAMSYRAVKKTLRKADLKISGKKKFTNFYLIKCQPK
jgi:2-polyprenyl-3-methyl-5-hydroxy-6-metoxy-1,4-benzoquinol methylase